MKLFFSTIKNILQLLSFSFKYSKKRIILIFVINSICGLIVPSGLIIWKKFIDYASKGLIEKDYTSILYAVAFIASYGIIIFLGNVLQRYSEYLISSEADCLNKKITSIVMDKINQLDTEKFDDSEIYDLIKKVNDQSSSRIMNILKNCMLLVKSFVLLAGTLSILLKIGLLPIVVCIASVIPSFLINVKIMNAYYTRYNERNEQMRYIEDLKELFIDNEYIGEIKLYKVGEYLENKIINILDEHIAQDKRLRLGFFVKTSVAELLDTIFMYGVIIYIVITVINSEYTIGDLTMFIGGIQQFIAALTLVFEIFSDLYDNNLYADSLFSLLNIPNENSKSNIPLMTGIESIEFEHVGFKYPGEDTEILKNINIRVEKGKVYNVVGLNGSGKTTLIKLLLGLYTPTSGRVLVNGIDLITIDKESYREKVSGVFQNFLKLPLSIKDNIAIGNVEEINSMGKIQEAAIFSGVNVFVEKFANKYDTRLNKKWLNSTELSMGQWQKIAVSRAYMSNRDTYIFDEPTSFLDAKAEKLFYSNVLSELSENLCIIVSHKLNRTILADEIFVLNEGRVIERGNHECLMGTKGEYYKLFSISQTQ